MKPDETSISASQSSNAYLNRSKPLSRPFGRQGHFKPEISVDKTSGMSAAVRPPSSEHVLYNKIQGASAAAHDIVQGIRAVDETMRQIGHNLNGMKHAVEKVLKSYPPFPVGSNERITQLRQFSALRKMIDQLTFPPKEDNSPAVILGDPQNHPSAGNWEYIPADGSQKLVVRRQPLHTGEQGLDIPDLPADAPDDALVDAVDRLTKASTTLDTRRKEFIAEANRVISAMI